MKMISISAAVLLMVLTAAALFGREYASNDYSIKLSHLKISKYEFEGDLKRFKNNYLSAHGRVAPEDSVKCWINSYFDNVYILREAYRRNLHKNALIKNDVANYAYTILTQNGGIVYRHFVDDNIRVDRKDIVETHEKSKTHFVLEMLYFKDYRAVHDLFGSNGIRNSAEFIRAKARNDSMHVAGYRVWEGAWPFVRLWEIRDSIYSMSQGAVSSPLVSSLGICIVYVKDKYTVDLEPLTTDGMSVIKGQLEYIARNRLESELYSGIEKKANIVCNTDAAQIFLKCINDNPNLLNDSSSTLSPYTSMTSLFTFNDSNKKLYVNIDKFLKYYRSRFMKLPINNYNDLNMAIKRFVYECYMMDYAKKLKLDKEPKFKYSKTVYLHHQMLNIFDDIVLAPHITVSGHEIDEYYRSHLTSFETAECSRYLLLTFNDSKDATRAYSIMKSFVKSYSKENVSGLLNKDPLFQGKANAVDTLTVYYNSDLFEKKIRSAISGMETNEISLPLQYSNLYLIFIKTGETGSRVKSLDEVHDEIAGMVKAEKIRTKRLELLTSLKNKYKLDHRVDLEKCI